MPGQVWETGGLQFVKDVARAVDFQRAAAAEQDLLRSSVCFPIKLGSKVLGVVELFSRRPREPDQGFLNTLSATGDKLGQFVERKRAEAALRRSEERMRHILETALDAVIAVESDGIITGWNPQAERTFGWAQAEAIGRSLFDLVIPARHKAVYEQGLRHYLETGEGPLLEKRLELTALHRSGREFPVELPIAPLVLEDRVSFGAFVRDISDRKAAEEALQQRVKELAAANADMERFNRAAVGRELRMVELKREINTLRAQAGLLPARYKVEFAEESAGAAPSPETNGEVNRQAQS